MSLARIVADAEDFVDTHRGTLDVATLASLDQASANLAQNETVDLLAEAWEHPEDLAEMDDVADDEAFLARLATAMAIVAKGRRALADGRF